MLGIKLKAELGDEVELSLEKVDVILIVLHQLLEQIAAHVVLDCMTMGRGFLVKRARRMPPHSGAVLDLVHRIGRVDVQRGARMDTRV